ncbi:discoidin domain-containing protein [Chloroflexota bacterium]
MAVLEQTVQVTSVEYAVEWQVLEPWPTQMSPDEELLANLLLRNIGTRTWIARGEHPVHLAYHWFTEDGKLSEPWDTFRTLLPQDIGPGATIILPDVIFKTPPVLGRYILRWDLVEEGQTWFFRQGGEPLEIPAEISDQSLVIPWTAQASHNLGDVGLAFDGAPDTFWDSKAVQEPGMWFQVDLGKELALDRVKVSSPGRGFPLGYKIKLSTNGQDWHLVAERAHNWTNIDVAIAPTTARYLRLEQTGTPSWPATWMISEITVSATRPWAGAGASHYSTYAEKALDASLDTYWNTRAVKQRPGMWFELDMGSPRRIEQVTLEHPKNELPRGYVVQVSTDGQSWQEIDRKEDNWKKADSQFSPTVARHIRVETTNSSSYTPWGITQIVVRRSSPTWLRGETD